jgi:hypothetical protein
MICFKSSGRFHSNIPMWRHVTYGGDDQKNAWSVNQKRKMRMAPRISRNERPLKRPLMKCDSHYLLVYFVWKKGSLLTAKSVRIQCSALMLKEWWRREFCAALWVTFVQ